MLVSMRTQVEKHQMSNDTTLLDFRGRRGKIFLVTHSNTTNIYAS